MVTNEEAEAYQEICRIKIQQWDCLLLKIPLAPCGKHINRLCCVNCEKFDTCLVPCPHSERWIVADAQCIFAMNCKKTEKEGKKKIAS